MLNASSLTLAATLAVAAGLVGCGADPTVTINLDEGELQSAVDRAFPYDTTRARTRIVLENPEVTLEDGSDRLGLSLDVRVDPPFMDEVQSRGTVVGALRYERTEAALYMDDPRITELELGQVSAANADRVRAVVEPVVRGAVRLFPIYRLDRGSLGETAAEYVLRSVNVEAGELLVEIGLPRGPGER